MDSSGTAGKDRKQVQNASNKISCVVHRVLVPLLSAHLPPRVSFRQQDTSDRGRALYEHLLTCEPCSVKDRASFVERMGSLYDSLAVQDRPDAPGPERPASPDAPGPERPASPDAPQARMAA